MRVIEIVAYVAESERPIVERAAQEVARALCGATPQATDCRCRFIESLDDVGLVDARAIVIASLLREVEPTEPWGSAEPRLRAAYTALAERDVPAFICTVFRYVDRGDDTAAERLVRIRRLNLLAMELSRLTGAYVIDIDRALADLGGFRLKTDYRLGGRVAREQAAHAIAGSLVADALDDVVPIDVQNDAAAKLDSARPTIEDASGTRELTLLPSAVKTVYGRRDRSVKPVHVTVQASRVDTALRNVLRGSIGKREIGSRLLHALRQRGLRTTTKLIAVGLAKQLWARR